MAQETMPDDLELRGPRFPLSVIIRAPHGIADCVHLDELLEVADQEMLEIVVVDGSSGGADDTRPGIKHVRAPTDFDPALVQYGLPHTSHDWIIVFEDHTRPLLPGYFAAYRRAIAANPDIELFSGPLENLTTTARWPFACFLTGNANRWPPAGLRPPDPTTANYAIRKTALTESERLEPGGIQVAALQRLTKQGRFRHCDEAVIDHVRPLEPFEAFELFRHWGRYYALLNAHFGPSGSVAIALPKALLRIAYWTAVKPFMTWFAIRGTSEFRLSHIPKFAFLGFAHSFGVLQAEIDLAFGRRVNADRLPG